MPTAAKRCWISRVISWGDDILLKYDSCFLKPARSGSATPWHQDNGLWRDGDLEPFNFWMALDPATIENGCLQMIPGSYKTEVVPHVLYDDSIHGELPKERVEEMIDTYGVEHIELQPGSVVVWHSSAWHYSPPNSSDKGRIAIAGVMSSPDIVENGRSGDVGYKWLMRDGVVATDFPAAEYDDATARALEACAMASVGRALLAGGRLAWPRFQSSRPPLKIPTISNAVHGFSDTGSCASAAAFSFANIMSPQPPEPALPLAKASLNNRIRPAVRPSNPSPWLDRRTEGVVASRRSCYQLRLGSGPIRPTLTEVVKKYLRRSCVNAHSRRFGCLNPASTPRHC